MDAIITCDGYGVVGIPATGDLPAECRRTEAERADGYAVLATRDGRIVADADGWWNRDVLDAPDPMDVACERRHDE